MKILCSMIVLLSCSKQFLNYLSINRDECIAPASPTLDANWLFQDVGRYDNDLRHERVNSISLYKNLKIVIQCHFLFAMFFITLESAPTSPVAVESVEPITVAQPGIPEVVGESSWVSVLLIKLWIFLSLNASKGNYIENIKNIILTNSIIQIVWRWNNLGNQLL